MSEVFAEIKRLPEFDRDLKRLVKKYCTLEEDIKNFIKTQLKLYHELKIDNGGIFRITGLGFDCPKIYKAKKFACRSLKGGSNSGVRIIYAYYESEGRIEFIEIYYKGYKENEDRQRITGIYKK